MLKNPACRLQMRSRKGAQPEFDLPECLCGTAGTIGRRPVSSCRLIRRMCSNGCRRFPLMFAALWGEAVDRTPSWNSGRALRRRDADVSDALRRRPTRPPAEVLRAARPGTREPVTKRERPAHAHRPFFQLRGKLPISSAAAPTPVLRSGRHRFPGPLRRPCDRRRACPRDPPECL